jgi:cysteinyl-tRNA synthetase
MVMGIIDWSILADTIIPANITSLAEERVEAKKNKNYSRSDTIRKEIEEAGFILVDTKEGFTIEKK